MSQSYNPPSFQSEAFHCPACGVYSSQMWLGIYAATSTRGNLTIPTSGTACCRHCEGVSIWHNERMIFPSGGAAPLPNPDLPDDIKRDYEEARSIVVLSPRGAAALLRLCVQKLCKDLGESGKDINQDIGNLVKKGLSATVQQTLDVVRVIGNESVHPGSLDLRDDQATALALFGLVNVIADSQISQPKRIAELYSTLPQTKLDGIKQRDGQL